MLNYIILLVLVVILLLIQLYRLHFVIQPHLIRYMHKNHHPTWVASGRPKVKWHTNTYNCKLLRQALSFTSKFPNDDRLKNILFQFKLNQLYAAALETALILLWIFLL